MPGTQAAATDRRLAVAPVGIGGRMQGLLQAYLSGPGRRTFVVKDAQSAQALIVDFDAPGSRAEWQRLRATYPCPVILLAMREPGLGAGTAWVRKPVTFEGLAQAATEVQAMLAAARSAASLPAATQLAVMAGDDTAPPPDEPSAPLHMAEQGTVPFEHPVARPSPAVATQALPRRAFGGESVPGLGKGLWMTAGVLGIVALATSLGWQPAGDAGRGGQGPGAAPPAVSVAHQVESAVQQSIRDYRLRSDEESRYIEAQRAEMQQGGSPNELRMRLDELAAVPRALAAHNEAVNNRVDLGQAVAQGTADQARRAVIDSVVAVALGSSQATDPAYVGQVLPEAEVRANEMRTVVVRPGDTLSSLARRVYGDPDAYDRIFRANPLVLASADHIYPGQVLRVPRDLLAKPRNRE